MLNARKVMRWLLVAIVVGFVVLLLIRWTGQPRSICDALLEHPSAILETLYECKHQANDTH